MPCINLQTFRQTFRQTRHVFAVIHKHCNIGQVQSCQIGSPLGESIMSKAIGNFVQKVQAMKNASGKFTATAVEGSRIIPSKSRDSELQLRIDAGHYDENTKKLNVVLQINS